MSIFSFLKWIIQKSTGLTNTPKSTSSTPSTTPLLNRITLHLYPDEHHLPRVGVLETGDQFIIDLNLIANNGKTRDFVCTYIFWANGALKNYIIDEVGIRGEYKECEFTKLIDKHVNDLGAYTISPIQFQPFKVIQSNENFGYVVRDKEPDAPKDADDYVDVLPGHTLMFYPPWEEGAYAT